MDRTANVRATLTLQINQKSDDSSGDLQHTTRTLQCLIWQEVLLESTLRLSSWANWFWTVFINFASLPYTPDRLRFLQLLQSLQLQPTQHHVQRQKGTMKGLWCLSRQQITDYSLKLIPGTSNLQVVRIYRNCDFENSYMTNMNISECLET